MADIFSWKINLMWIFQISRVLLLDLCQQFKIIIVKNVFIILKFIPSLEAMI